MAERTKFCFVLLIMMLFQLIIYAQTGKVKLSIEEAIELGIKNNPQLLSARENISASKGKYWSGISLPQPEIGLTYEYIPTGNGFNNYGERTFEVKQSFEFPSNYLLKENRLSREEEITYIKLLQAERSVTKQIKTNYYKVLAKQFQLKTAIENVKISEDFYKKAEIRQNVGEGTNLEKLTAKIQYTEAKNNLEVMKNDLSKTFTELNYSLGIKSKVSSIDYELTDTLTFIVHSISMDNLVKSLDELNPAIKIAELNKRIAGVDKDLAWSSFLPNFNLAYYQQSVSGNNGFYGASVGISVPIWFMMDQRGKIMEANANHAVSESELQQTKNEVYLKLKEAVVEHQNSIIQVNQYVKEILPQVEEIYESARKSYDAGEVTYLEYLQAKQLLINTRGSYINTLLNHYQSDFEIEELAGITIIEKMELEK